MVRTSLAEKKAEEAEAKEAEKAEAEGEEKIRLKQYVSLLSKGRHNKIVRRRGRDHMVVGLITTYAISA